MNACRSSPLTVSILLLIGTLTPVFRQLGFAAEPSEKPAAATHVSGHGQPMAYQQAKQRIPSRTLPDFWVGDVAGLGARFDQLKLGQLTTIARSPGGRPLYLVSYGHREEVAHHANFNSAIAGHDPLAYMDKKFRRKPVLFFIGPVHGHEVEGLTGLVNLIQVMETGRDLRGQEKKALRELGKQCRLLILPSGNPDGTARFEPRALHGMTLDDVYFWGQGTWSDGTIAIWPYSKRLHPFHGPRVQFMGCYFDDAGVNPMQDEFFAPLGPEAPAILRVAMQEGPDWAVSLHSNGGAPQLLRTAYVPLEVQEQVRLLAESTNLLLEKRGLPHKSAPKVEPDSGTVPPTFNLTSAVYHVSGAIAFTFEGPHGLAEKNYCQASFDQILDMQLILYEAMLRFAVETKTFCLVPENAP
jgi:hypothetical protein